MSGDADDKLAACLNWPCTSKVRAAQEYFDACARWFAMLSPDDRDAVRTINYHRRSGQRPRARRQGHGRVAAAGAEAPPVKDALALAAAVLWFALNMVLWSRR
jgi:hypothetical protein